MVRGVIGSVSLNTDGLFITRKRKKWKFAHFDSWPNCFSLNLNQSPETVKKDIRNYLGKTKYLVVELAAGNAQFSLELARRYPSHSFIAVDIKSDRLYTSAKQAISEGINNIVFLRMDIRRLSDIFGAKSVDEVWLTFPDPHPKKRSAKHRLSGILYLRQYRKILKNTGFLKFKTDNRELFLWSLEQFVADKWQFSELSFDLHESNLADDYKIMTYYEERFTGQGVPTNLAVLSSDQQ